MNYSEQYLHPHYFDHNMIEEVDERKEYYSYITAVLISYWMRLMPITVYINFSLSRKVIKEINFITLPHPFDIKFMIIIQGILVFIV